MQIKILGVLAIVSTLAGTAQAQEQERKPGIVGQAGKIATQPARDVGLDKDEIPPVLVKAVDNPYAAPASRSCAGLTDALKELNAVLGPDFTVGATENQNRTGKIASAVGRTVVNSLIPFRGLVREVSGAAPAERRLQAAVTAGIARRGYLRGMAAAKKCTPPA